MQLIVPPVISNNLAMLQGSGGMAFTCLQVFVMLTSYSTEMKQAMPYSKFAHNVIETSNKKSDAVTTTPSTASSSSQQQQMEVSSRVGMLIIYTPALLVSALALFGNIPSFLQANNMTLAGILCLIHFVKRDLEVLFLHQYSGSTPLATASLIGFFYTVNAWLTCTVSTSTPSPMAAQLGTLLFGIGIVGNFYHHYLLATLRRGNNKNNNNTTAGSAISSKKYFAPKGGLFEYVAAPHYLFELIGWLGIAIASQHLNVYLVLGGMVSYLAARAKRQNDWNGSKFSNAEWPPSQRKNLVPFLF